MSDATIGIIGTIVGTVLGFGLSELSTWFRERRAATTRANAVRQLLIMDIKGYIGDLEHTLQHVRISQPGGVVHSHTSPSTLFEQILQSQPLLVAEVFKPEHIPPLFNFYGSMGPIIGFLQQLALSQEAERFNELKVRTIDVLEGTLAIGKSLLEQLTQHGKDEARG